MNRPAVIRAGTFDAGFFESKKETRKLVQRVCSTGYDTSELLEQDKS